MYKLFTDGGARGNPGPSAIAYVIFADDSQTKFDSEYIGIATNNQAEYQALRLGLNVCLKLNIKELYCYLDSELVVKQMNGQYKVKDANIKVIFDEIKTLCKRFENITFNHIRRSENAIADKLVNICLDAQAN